MKSLLTREEFAEIEALEKGIGPTYTATQAWTCFSAPKEKIRTGNGKKKKIFRFTSAQVALLKSAKQKVLQYLNKRSNYSCEYCRRSRGQHGLSRHIEHVHGKMPAGGTPFTLSNLANSCMDCNFTKYQFIERPKLKVTIIDPATAGFNYSDHLNYLQISTEDFHLLHYTQISTEGISTYAHLRFKMLERAEMLKQLSPISTRFLSRLDAYLHTLPPAQPNTELTNFLLSMKSNFIK